MGWYADFFSYDREVKRIEKEVAEGRATQLAVQDMMVPVRVEKMLLKAGMKTVGDVMENLEELRKMKGWGEVTDWWVSSVLKSFGVW